jgi:SAM-dependent methyltransferase
MAPINPDRDYVLGTGDDEVARLALQHLVWRPRVWDAWRQAGFTSGQTLLDIGCGPGHASLDLAEVVGPSGRVIALDRSSRFLDALRAGCQRRGFDQVEARELDLDEDPLPPFAADGAWCRWVFAFVKRPRALLEQIAQALRPRGVLVMHEYFDYSTWRMAPRCTEVEEFVHMVMDSWRAQGGEPDIGLSLPGWLDELGLAIKSIRPIIDVVPASSFVWQWPRTFLQAGLGRLVELRCLTVERAHSMAQAFAACEARPATLMITPAVLEIVAVAQQ